jgi:hypothetical protein
MKKITPKLVPMSPYELYLQRVNTTVDSVRKVNKGLDYTPIQFGGIFGQAVVANGSAILEVTDFEIGND